VPSNAPPPLVVPSVPFTTLAQVEAHINQSLGKLNVEELVKKAVELAYDKTRGRV
jgi:hypothetical protein